MKQTTIADSFSVKGKGLHTGLEIEATFNPAPENHGYKFQRIDVEGQPVIDALAEFVTSTTRGTVISRGDVSVSTIEHALAALYAAGGTTTSDGNGINELSIAIKSVIVQ